LYGYYSTILVLSPFCIVILIYYGFEFLYIEIHLAKLQDVFSSK
jgi:hypothetical protein